MAGGLGLQENWSIVFKVNSSWLISGVKLVLQLFIMVCVRGCRKPIKAAIGVMTVVLVT